MPCKTDSSIHSCGVGGDFDVRGRAATLLADRLRDYRPPGQGRVEGFTLRADMYYSASLHTDTDELWLTYAGDLAGPANALTITP